MINITNGLFTWSVAKNSRNIREKFAKNLWNIRKIFAKYSRKIKICEIFAKNSWKNPEKFANVNFLRIFRKYFANFSRIFHNRPREESVSALKFFLDHLRPYSIEFMDYKKLPKVLSSNKKGFWQWYSHLYKFITANKVKVMTYQCRPCFRMKFEFHNFPTGSPPLKRTNALKIISTKWIYVESIEFHTKIRFWI